MKPWIHMMHTLGIMRTEFKGQWGRGSRHCQVDRQANIVTVSQGSSPLPSHPGWLQY
jgi:hypothetical protein